MIGVRCRRPTESHVLNVGRACAGALLAWWPFAMLQAQPACGARSTQSCALRIEEPYAAAAAKLLGDPGDQRFVLLATRTRGELATRARPGSGEAQMASLTTLRDVARILARRGYHGGRVARAALAPSAVLQLVLGELRFEPAGDSRFARLTIRVIGSDGKAVAMDVLLKRDVAGWRAINMESADSIG